MFSKLQNHTSTAMEDTSLNEASPKRLKREIVIVEHSLRDPCPVDKPLSDVTKYMFNRQAGLYDEVNDLIGNEEKNLETRRTVVKASLFVVAITASFPGQLSLHCSGIIIEIKDKTMVLTSGYILGDFPSTPKVDILLPDKKNVIGHISSIDRHHNIILISGEFDGMTPAVFDETFPLINDAAIAIGRSPSMLIASSGSVNVRRDHFESDDLFSSNCCISEFSIGGPLVNSSGFVIGINFFSKKFSTPFLPSRLLLKCVEDLVCYGQVLHPWIGLKLRTVIEVDASDFESMYESTDGLFVKQVIKGSPAHKAGIKTGDIVISCNGVDITSPAQFTCILFPMLPPRFEGVPFEVVIHCASAGTKETKRIAEMDYYPSDIGSWPLLPPYRPSRPKLPLIHSSAKQ